MWARHLLVAVFLACLLACGGSPSSPAPAEVCSGYPDWQTSPCVVPYPVGTSYRVAQGNCSGAGHSGIDNYSYDFDMPIGTLVTAALPNHLARGFRPVREETYLVGP